MIAGKILNICEHMGQPDSCLYHFLMTATDKKYYNGRSYDGRELLTGTPQYMHVQKMLFHFNAHCLLADQERQEGAEYCLHGGGGMRGEKGKFGHCATSSAHLLLALFEGMRKPSVQYFIVTI
jgi:hypothetical protein